MKPLEQELPENINRCLNCPHGDCRFNNIQDCIKSERCGKKPRKVGRPKKFVAIAIVPPLQTLPSGTDWSKQA